MKKTKEIRKNILKNNRGITMVSLIITIVLMVIISSSALYVSYDMFQINKLRKMYNDIELLSEKVKNYYITYNGIPVLRDEENNLIEYTYTTLDFDKNVNDSGKYYILDLQAMDGISLNYGEEGFNNPNTSEDVYIINEVSHTIYYVQGIELEEVMYYTLTNNTETAKDNIPPSKPEIKIISGTTDDNGTYITDVKFEIIPGKDSWSGVEKTVYSINGSSEVDITNLNNNLYTIDIDGTYEIKARSYDNENNASEYATRTIVVSKKSIILDQSAITLEIESGATTTAELTATLENVSKDFKWTASEDSGLIISGEGNTKTITATKPVENATITVSYGTVSATCSVEVVEKQSSSANLISFTVDGTTYSAEEGMTWEQWVGSDYDTSNGLIYILTLPSGTIMLRYSDSFYIYDR